MFDELLKDLKLIFEFIALTAIFGYVFGWTFKKGFGSLLNFDVEKGANLKNMFTIKESEK